MTLHYVIILIKPVFNKDPCNYYNNTFLEKCLYQLAKNKLQQVLFARFFK